ncbi:hypothetical protein RCL1_005775 [Eukaryota sp. TZLM3-RCL]
MLTTTSFRLDFINPQVTTFKDSAVISVSWSQIKNVTLTVTNGNSWYGGHYTGFTRKTQSSWWYHAIPTNPTGISAGSSMTFRKWMLHDNWVSFSFSLNRVFSGHDFTTHHVVTPSGSAATATCFGSEGVGNLSVSCTIRN